MITIGDFIGTEKELRDLVDKLGSVAATARKIGVPRETLRDLLRRQVLTGDESIKVSRKGKFAVVTSSSESPKSAERILEKAELDPKKWSVIETEVQDKLVRYSTGPRHTFITKLKLVPKAMSNNPSEAVESLLSGFSLEDVPEPLVKENYEQGENMALVNISDFHLGMLCTEDETGVEWNLIIAESKYRSLMGEICEKLREIRPQRILFIVGNDFFHVDGYKSNLRGASTTAGTLQDLDGRVHNMFQVGLGLNIMAIRELSKIARTDVLLIPGNHDRLLSTILAESLKQIFPEIGIDSRPIERKYYRYGCNLIGFTHGKLTKNAVKNLPNLMIEECVDVLGITHREWILGHTHTRSVECIGNSIIRRFPSLSPNDSWHTQMMYSDKRAFDLLIYARKGGNLSRITFK